MADYTLSLYEEALKVYDQNAWDIKCCFDKELEDLTDLFNKWQEDTEKDQFLSLSEKKRMLKKRQEWFDRLRKERENQLQADLQVEREKKEEFKSQNWWFDYHCFVTINELNKLKEAELWELNQELIRKQEELARLQKEIKAKQQEVDNVQNDLNAIKTGTLHDVFFELDVMPRIKNVELALKALVLDHNDEYDFPQDFVDRTIRCLIKESKKEKEDLNYEDWKLKLSFNTVENRTKWESQNLKDKVISILTDWWFIVSKSAGYKPKFQVQNKEIPTFSTVWTSIYARKSEHEWVNKQYLKEKLTLLDKTDIRWRIDIFKQLSFSFANESAFIKQVETASAEWVDLIEDIDRWLQQYMVKPFGIEPRIADDKKEYYKISLDCKQRNPRMLMVMVPSVWLNILCVAPHIDYDNILRWQTTNYFQTWKWDWTKRWKQWRKTWRA